MWSSSNKSKDKEFHISNWFVFVSGIFVSEPCRPEDSAILLEVRMIANKSACQNGAWKREGGKSTPIGHQGRSNTCASAYWEKELLISLAVFISQPQEKYFIELVLNLRAAKTPRIVPFF